MSVLVIASEILIGMHAETVLVALGYADVRVATVAQGLQQVGDGAPELAILDADLGSPVFALAETLRQRGAPVIFLGVRTDLPPEWEDVPILAKPLERGELGRIIAPVRERRGNIERNTS